MPYELDLSRDDFEFLPRFDTHLMHGAPALRTYLLFFGRPVFHRLHGEAREHGLATTLLLAALVGDLLYSGLGQKGIGYRLGFIEKAAADRDRSARWKLQTGAVGSGGTAPHTN